MGAEFPSLTGGGLFGIRFSPQELLSREEELKQAALKQKSQEEFLRQREHELAQWELEVFERELSLLIQQMNRDRPHVKKRKGTFKRNKLRGRDSERISMPLGKKARLEAGLWGRPSGGRRRSPLCSF